MASSSPVAILVGCLGFEFDNDKKNTNTGGQIENDQWDRVEKAHISTCGLTALKLRDGKLVTLSIDQRVLLFDMSLTLIKGAMTQVTDGAALVPVDNDRLIIAGDGLEEMDF